MIKVKAAGVLLDVIENGSIQITKSVQDVESYVDRSGGGYSIPFTMPFTPKNNEFFANYHSVSSQADGILFDATKKTDVIIEEDGMIVLEGFMQLVGANQTQRVYEVVCFERVISLTDTIRNRRVRDLRLWTTYPHSFSLANIQDSWTNNLFGGDIVYPVVDYGDRRSTFGLGIFDYTFRPWIKLKRIFDSILSEAGIRYESNFLSTDPRFTEMYISGSNSGIVVDAEDYRFRVVLQDEVITNLNIFDAKRHDLNFTFTGGTVPSTSLLEVNEPSSTPPFAGNFFTPLATGLHDMRLFLTIQSNNITATSGFLTTYPNEILVSIFDSSNNTFVTTQTISIPGNIQPTSSSVTIRDFEVAFQSVNLFAGNDYTILYQYFSVATGAGVIPVNIQTISGETYWEMLGPPNASIGLPIDMAQNAPDMGQLDLVRAVINHFNLMIETDPITPDVVKIEPFNDYYDSGNTIDWTKKIDMSQGVVVKPTTDLQAKFNTWKFSDDNDYFSSKRVLGQFSFESDNEFAQGEQLVELPYGAPPTQTGFPYGITYRIIDEQDGAFSPIDHLPRVGYLRTNFGTIRILNSNTNTLQVYQNSAVFAHHVYQNNTPRVLPFSTNANLYNQFFDLTFNSAKNYGVNAGIETNTVNNAFTVFWQRYVNEIYNNEARILEAYFSLSPADINTFRFNDKVFIKDTFYRVLEIQNYTVGERATTKVILLSLTGEALSPFTDCDGVPTGFNADGMVSFSGSNIEQCCNRYGYTFVNGTCRWRPLGGGQIDPPNPTVFLPDLNQPIYGVCCYTPTEGEPSCAQLTELQCLTLNGTWLGPSADCSDCGLLVPEE